MANESLLAQFGLDIAPLTQSLKRATHAVKEETTKMGKEGFGELLGPIAKVAAAVGSIGAIMEGLHGALELGADMQDLSNRTGIAVGALYMLQNAFKDAGVDAAKLAPSVGKMKATIAESVGGGGQASILHALGLDARTLANEAPNKAFEEIGTAIANLKNPYEQAEDARKIFGKGGEELLALFNNPNFKNAGGISNLAADLEKSSPAFKEIEENFKHVGRNVQGFFVGVASTSAGVFAPIIHKLENVDFSKWGERVGIVAANFGTNFHEASKNAIEDLSKLIGIALSGDSLKLFGLELVIQGSKLKDVLFDAFREPLNYYAAQMEALTNKALNAWNKLNGNSGKELKSLYADQERNTAGETNAYNRYHQVASQLGGVDPYTEEGKAKYAEFDRLKKALEGYQKQGEYIQQAINTAKNGLETDPDKIAAQNKANGIDYVKQAHDAANNNRAPLEEAAGEFQKKIAEQFSGLTFKSFKYIPGSGEKNAEGQQEAADLYKKPAQSDFNLADIGANKFSIIADSLERVGGGGRSALVGDNPILTENRRQSALLQKIAENTSRAPGAVASIPAAAFAQ